jgi:predicted RND superfamily exporter protein
MKETKMEQPQASNNKHDLTEEEFTFLVSVPDEMKKVSAQANTYAARKVISEKAAAIVRDSIKNDNTVRHFEEVTERLAQEFRYAKGAFETGRYYQLLLRIRDENTHLSHVEIPNDERIVAGFDFGQNG